MDTESLEKIEIQAFMVNYNGAIEKYFNAYPTQSTFPIGINESYEIYLYRSNMTGREGGSMREYFTYVALGKQTTPDDDDSSFAFYCVPGSLCYDITVPYVYRGIQKTVTITKLSYVKGTGFVYNETTNMLNLTSLPNKKNGNSSEGDNYSESKKLYLYLFEDYFS